MRLLVVSPEKNKIILQQKPQKKKKKKNETAFEHFLHPFVCAYSLQWHHCLFRIKIICHEAVAR